MRKVIVLLAVVAVLGLMALPAQAMLMQVDVGSGHGTTSDWDNLPDDAQVTDRDTATTYAYTLTSVGEWYSGGGSGLNPTGYPDTAARDNHYGQWTTVVLEIHALPTGLYGVDVIVGDGYYSGVVQGYDVTVNGVMQTVTVPVGDAVAVGSFSGVVVASDLVISIDNATLDGVPMAYPMMCGVSIVPEPATLSLLGVGLVGVLLRRRRR